MKKTIIPPVIDHNNMVGAFGFSESSSMKIFIDIGNATAAILTYSSAFVKDSKKNCNVLSSFFLCWNMDLARLELATVRL